MRHDNVCLFHFSATGTTKTVVETMGKTLAGNPVVLDLLQNPLDEETAIGPDSLVIVGLPVYSGRIPTVCRESLAKLKGRHTPAIAVVVFGNRDYDDALLELKNTLEDNGFFVFGAAAFVARHAIFPQVAAQRPDEEDLRAVTKFAADCAHKLESMAGLTETGLVHVKGNYPYKEAQPVALKPSADDSCTLCGACVEVCPTNSLALGDALVKNNDLCIACAACVWCCPAKAQAFRGPEYDAYAKVFGEKFSLPKKPEIFL